MFSVTFEAARAGRSRAPDILQRGWVCMSVNIAVCGKFHYHNHVRFLDRAGALNRFFYAAKRSTNADDLGIAPEHAANGWMKEYLVHGHLRVLGNRAADWLFPL